jgi:hypothetical protein
MQLFQAYHQIGVDSALVYFHPVEVGCIADILEEHAAFIFWAKSGTVSECSFYTGWWCKYPTAESTTMKHCESLKSVVSSDFTLNNISVALS